MLLPGRLLSWLGREGRPDLALAAFDWMESRREYVAADCHVFTRLMSIFARLPGGSEAALGLFDRMRRAGIQPDVVAFNCAIGAAGVGLSPLHPTSCPTIVDIDFAHGGFATTLQHEKCRVC